MAADPTHEGVSLSRQDVQERTAAVQRRIIDAFPLGAVSDTVTSGWTLLACSETEVQSATGAQLTFRQELDIAETHDAIVRATRDDGYTATTDTTPKGAPRLTITGPADDQYLITIYNDTMDARISTFSQCFPGALTDD